MFRTFLLFLLFATTLFAKSYNFTELRYSDAIGRYTQVDGVIEFFNDGLKIVYPKAKKELIYKDDDLHYLQEGREIELPSLQKAQMAQYFELLGLIHRGDSSEISEMFDISQKDGMKILTPTGSIKNYIKYIQLQEDSKLFHNIKLFLQNNDTISITIDG